MPKVIGHAGMQDTAQQFQRAEEESEIIRETLEQAFALLFANPAPVSGLASFPAEWTP
jgi:hypothetical protein